MFYSLQPLKLPDRLGDVIFFPNRKVSGCETTCSLQLKVLEVVETKWCRKTGSQKHGFGCLKNSLMLPACFPSLSQSQIDRTVGHI
jgi:hypothetical protein